jgi:capsular polysaccharide biosynthesis protein
VASAQIKQIMDVSAVQTVYEAEVPLEPSSPNVMHNTILAAALGLVAVIGTYAAIYMLDEAIHTEEDVTRYLGLGTLGVIPMSTEMSVREAGRTPQKHGSKTAFAKPAQRR